MFVTVARLGEIPPGTGRQVTVGERWVGLFNLGGQYHAIDNVCLHRGGPLCEGPIAGNIVTCPWHGWQYDVTSGKTLQNPNAGVGCYATDVRGDEIYVDAVPSS
jgi:nitrite reductase/ring-hydroxylating ferredoxin subunit